MLEQIIKEKTSADHLLYVSMKYTKTCEVILNLISRWTVMIDLSIEGLLEQAKKKKKIKIIPIAPKQKLNLAKSTFKEIKEVTEALELYEFFKMIPKLQTSREHEFRKDVCLRVIENQKETEINLEMLKEYSIKLENFIGYVKQFLLS